jgi:hypothetical protein
MDETWKYFLGDDFWLHLKKEDDGEVEIQLRHDGEEECGFWIPKNMVTLIGKKIQELGDSDSREENENE